MNPGRPVSPPLVERVARIGRAVCVALAVGHAALFLAVWLLRLPYPYDLEWMEGGQLLQSYEILAGRFPYRAPSADHIAYLYQPLYAALVAALGAVFGLSLPLARAVSGASTVACALLVGRIVWRETASRRHAALAAGAVFGLYRVTGFWFDLARVDSLFLALLVGGLYAARYIEVPSRAAVASALLLVLAYKTKQLALPFFFVALAALAAKRRRAAALFAVLAGCLLVGDYVVEERVSHGWFSFFVDDVPHGQPFELRKVFRFWLVLLSDVPVLVLLGLEQTGVELRLRPWREKLGQTWPLAAFVGLAASLAAWPRPGGAANNLMTTYVLAVVPAFVGLARLERSTAPATGALASWAVAAQLAWLTYDPGAQIPRRADYEAGRQLVGLLRDAPGPVLVPERPWLPVLAGKQPSYHADSYWDIAYQSAGALLPADLPRRLRDGYYALVVIRSPERFAAGDVLSRYRCEPSLHLPGRALAAFTGNVVDGPKWVCRRRSDPVE